MNYTKLLRIFLWLVAIHSFTVGIFLMFSPIEIIQFFGFRGYENNFFRAQGGIFHVVMSMAYIMAVAKHIHRNLLWFSIFAKFTATIFLISYFVFVDQIITLLLSGLADFSMGIIIYFLMNSYQKSIADKL